MWKGNERAGWVQTTASEACARRTCRTCSTSCSSPVGHVCAVSMPRWPKAAMMLPLALLNVLGLRFTPQTMRPSNAPGHTPSDVSMHRCHSKVLPYRLLLIVTRTACRPYPTNTNHAADASAVTQIFMKHRRASKL